MSAKVTIAPSHSLLLIAEAPTDAPMKLAVGSRIGSTPSCIAVGCLMYQDGETKVTLGHQHRNDGRPAFDGYLDTPHRKVAVWTIEWDMVLETSVPTTRTRIRVWTNHPTEPDDIGVGEGA